jgi:hypothetical protein
MIMMAVDERPPALPFFGLLSPDQFTGSSGKQPRESLPPGNCGLPIFLR